MRSGPPVLAESYPGAHVRHAERPGHADGANRRHGECSTSHGCPAAAFVRGGGWLWRAPAPEHAKERHGMQAGAKLESIIYVRAPALRGTVAVGCASGQVSILDPRSGFKAEQVVSAHAGRLVAMDVAAGLMATSGLGTRQGQMVPDSIVKVQSFPAGPILQVKMPWSLSVPRHLGDWWTWSES